MLFAWIVAAAVWFLVPFTVESCSHGMVPGHKPHPGATEICDKGNMTASTASPVQPGTSISLSCQLSPAVPRCRVAIFSNRTELDSNYGHSVSTEVRLRTYGKHTFTCKTVCGHKKKLICGIDIECGDPPDEPRNVSCVQHGTDGHPTCTWDKGRLTYIHTTYVVQLSNGTNVLCVSEKGLSKKVGSLALSKLNFDSTYTLVVAASNELGSAFSQPLVFTLIDIVKPHPPNFLVEFENSSVTGCAFFWHDQAPAQHCRLRYRPLTRHSWSTVESLTGEKCSLYSLEPHTAYEFQGSCKIHPERGLWSNWSTYQARTPEAVPTGLLDVWYRQEDVDLLRQNISLFWKALSKSEARGRILRYSVTFEVLDQQSPPAEEAHLTTQTSYARVMPRGDYKITVTAENSRGRSPPASIMTDLGTQDLPPPQNVSAVAMGNSSILISWKPPIGSTVAISGYVVEWEDTGWDTRLEPHPAWVKLPASNLSTVIAEHIKDNLCYQISVSALYRDRAGQAASVRGHSSAAAPSAGPQMYTTAQANGVVVWWEAIPAHQQRGCVTYRIYLWRKDGQGEPAVYAISNSSAQRSLHIPDLQPGEHYILWMTASTEAGEGPRGNSELLTLETTCHDPPFNPRVAHVRSPPPQRVSRAAPGTRPSCGRNPGTNLYVTKYCGPQEPTLIPDSKPKHVGAGNWTTFALTCSFFVLSACVCLVPPARKALNSLLSALVPQWQNKAIPDPANATWAKNYTNVKAELSWTSIPFLPSTGSFEEPETIQVEETFVKSNPPSLRDKVLSGRRGNGEWPPTSSSGQEEPRYQALPGTAEGEVYKQPLPDLYKRIVVEVVEHTQSASEYIASPATDTATGYLPLVMGTAEEHPELECNALCIFPRAFLVPDLSCEGKLTLEAVKINCGSFPR